MPPPHDLWQWLDGGPGLAMAAIAIVSIGCYLAIVRAGATTKSRRRYPPYANGTMFQNVAMLSSRNYPLLVVQAIKEAQSAVVRLSLPLPGTYVLVGESTTQRKILQDKLSSKPLEIYDTFYHITKAETMFLSNGDKWHKRRKRIAPAFSSNQVKRMNQVAVAKTDDWIEETFGAERTAVFDVSVEMNRVVLSAIIATAFQYDVSEEEAMSFGHELELALVEFILKSFNPMRALVGLLLPERRRAHVAVQRMHGLVRKIMENYQTLQKSERIEGSIIQLIMDSDEAFPSEIDKQAQLLELIIAGHDTTAYSIAWILICLAKNPDVQSKLRGSLQNGNESSSEYLKYVIKEGMRLHPVAADGSIRQLGKDMTTVNGELLPEKTIAFMPNVLIMRNPDVFRDPDKFDPSRWESPSREMLDSWTPFSLGKQNCVGQSLANAETNSIITRICSEFELSIAEEGSPDFFLTWKPSGYRLMARRIV